MKPFRSLLRRFLPPVFIAFAFSGTTSADEAIEEIVVTADFRERAALERVNVRGARIALRGIEPIMVNAEVSFGADGAVSKARVALVDGSLTADVLPREGSASVHVRGSRYTPPIGPSYVFEDIELTATVTPRRRRSKSSSIQNRPSQSPVAAFAIVHSPP